MIRISLSQLDDGVDTGCFEQVRILLALVLISCAGGLVANACAESRVYKLEDGAQIEAELVDDRDSGARYRSHQEPR